MTQYVVLYIIGADPDIVNARLAPLVADRSQRKGESSLRFGERGPRIVAKRPCWGYVGNTSKSEIDSTIHFRRLLASFEAVWGPLLELARTNQVVLTWIVNVYADEQTPASGLEPDVVRKMAELGAKLDVDMYFFSDQIAPEATEGEA